MQKNASNVNSVSNVHVNSFCSPSEDTALEQNVPGYTRRSSLTLFIPRNVEIDRLLRENPPNFHYFRDCFVYILHIISSIPNGNWDLLDEDGFSAVNKKILQKRIHDYKPYVDYLVAQGVITESRHYIPDKKSRGMKFCERFQSELIPVPITKWTLIKSITGLHEKVNIEKTLEMHFLKKWFNPKIQVDLEGARSFLSELKASEEAANVPHAQQAYNSRLLPLLELVHGEYSFGVDNTGYRLHTNLTRTMRELRKFIKFDGKILHSVDIVNSQPFLARPLFNKSYFSRCNILSKIINPRLTTLISFPTMLVEIIERVKNLSDVQNYLKIVSNGTFYESFAELLIQNNLFEGDVSERDEVKKITFATLYSPNQAIGYKAHVRIFSRVFPGVYEMIKKIKFGRKTHNAYSILLQRLEAELILQKVCKRINCAFPQIPIFTIHDSVITTEEYVPIVRNFMKKIMKQNVGSSPILKVEKWV